MEQEKDFDCDAFLELLGEVVTHHGTGVLNARIHVRNGMPWAVSVQFDNAPEKAA